MKRRSHNSHGHENDVTQHARSLIAATSHLADEKIADARAKLSEVVENAQEAVEYVEERAVATAKRTDEFIREKPYQAVGVAIGIGALLGYLFARRKD